MYKKKLALALAGLLTTLGLAVAVAPVQASSVPVASVRNSVDSTPPLLPVGAVKAAAHGPKGDLVTRGAPTLSSLASTNCGLCYYYAGGTTGTHSGTDYYGIGTSAHVEKPTVASPDYHSLMELAVQRGSGASAQAVEVGWIVDPGNNGDNDPHLFSGAWRNGTFLGYNTCVDITTTATNIGANLQTLGHVGTIKQMSIQHFGAPNNAWYLAYNGQWICGFPDTTWTNNGASFPGSDNEQAFGEVAAQCSPPHSTMGHGNAGVTGGTYPTAGASIQNVNTYRTAGSSTGTLTSLGLFNTNSALYNAVPISGVITYSFRYGGAGDQPDTGC